MATPIEEEIAREVAAEVAADILGLLPARRGHFLLESGHHGELWLELPRLCLRPEPVRRLAGHLAARLERHRVEVVCAPLVDGAFVGLMVAERLGVPFTYAEPQPPATSGGLFAVAYRVPHALRAELAGRRVGVVNDVINAGSAVRGAITDVAACNGQPVAIATLAVLGEAAARFAGERGLALERLAELPNAVWDPGDCPLCARNVPLDRPT